jgi:hypothetical protein
MNPRELLTVFDRAYQDRFGVRAPLTGAKDGKLASELLKLYQPVDLERWVRAFFQIPDPFIQQSGYTFGVFKACLGKVIAYAERRQAVMADPREGAMRQKIASRKEAELRDAMERYQRTGKMEWR